MKSVLKLKHGHKIALLATGLVIGAITGITVYQYSSAPVPVQLKLSSSTLSGSSTIQSDSQATTQPQATDQTTSTGSTTTQSGTTPTSSTAESSTIDSGSATTNGTSTNPITVSSYRQIDEDSGNIDCEYTYSDGTTYQFHWQVINPQGSWQTNGQGQDGHWVATTTTSGVCDDSVIGQSKS